VENNNTDQWVFTYCPLDKKIDWHKLCSQFDWLNAMGETQQNPNYHAEGDVLTHTKMVCEALVSMNEWQVLNNEEKSILFLAALLHDVAKPICTRIENGEITSSGHAVKGELYARNIIYKSNNTSLQMPFDIREKIVKLVKYHGLPLFFLEKPNPQKAVILASQTVRMDWLEMLAKADALGRISNDQRDLIDRITLFNDFCEENKCLKSPRIFPNNFSRFEYFSKDHGTLDYEAYDDSKFTVTLMSGLPASGKDTWVEKNFSKDNIISLDDIREDLDVLPCEGQGEVIMAAKEKAKEFLRVKKSFVWNATNLTFSLRSQLISLFRAYGARVRIVYVEVSYKELLKRNRERSRNVPEVIIDRMSRKLEVPTGIEAHEVILITKSP